MATYEKYVRDYKKKHPKSNAYLTKQAWTTSRSLPFKMHRMGMKPGPATKIVTESFPKKKRK